MPGRENTETHAVAGGVRLVRQEDSYIIRCAVSDAVYIVYATLV